MRELCTGKLSSDSRQSVPGLTDLEAMSVSTDRTDCCAVDCLAAVYAVVLIRCQVSRLRTDPDGVPSLVTPHPDCTCCAMASVAALCRATLWDLLVKKQCCLEAINYVRQATAILSACNNVDSGLLASRGNGDRKPVSDEWYSLPVDVKYGAPCVTRELLEAEGARLQQQLDSLPTVVSPVSRDLF